MGCGGKGDAHLKMQFGFLTWKLYSPHKRAYRSFLENVVSRTSTPCRGPSEAPQKFVKLGHFLPVFLHFSGNCRFIKHPFIMLSIPLCIYIPMYTIFIDRRTQHCRMSMLPLKHPKQTHTYTVIWLKNSGS